MGQGRRRRESGPEGWTRAGHLCHAERRGGARRRTKPQADALSVRDQVLVANLEHKTANPVVCILVRVVDVTCLSCAELAAGGHALCLILLA